MIEEAIRTAVREEISHATDTMLARIIEELSRPEQSATPSILRKKDILAATGLSISSIYSMIEAGTFPPSIQLGPRSSGWKRTDINAWLNGKRDW